MRQWVAAFLGATLIPAAAGALDAHDVLDLSANGFSPTLIVRILREMGDLVVLSDDDLRELDRAGVDAEILAYLRSREPALPGERTGVPQRVAAARQLTTTEPRPASRDPSEIVRRLTELRRRQSVPSIWPARGEVTSGYGYRASPVTGMVEFHEGIDIAAALGVEIVATAPGRVTFAGDLGLLGQAIVIEHGFGVRTTIGHAGALHVQTGQRVERGDRVASVGSSGRSTGPHVHYAVEVEGRSVDPSDYVPE